MLRNHPLFPDFRIGFLREGEMGRRWTAQDVSELKLLAQHHPPQRIAELINRTVGGVIFKAHTLKVSLRCPDMTVVRSPRTAVGPAGAAQP